MRIIFSSSQTNQRDKCLWPSPQFSEEADEVNPSTVGQHVVEGTQGKPTKDNALVLDFFAGSCRLSKDCRDVGLRATAVEKDKQRAEQFSIFCCDVTKREDVKPLMDYIEAESECIAHAHFAPSCGTCSRAREIKIPDLPPGRQPQPLRGNTCPDGFPNLSEVDQLRVDQANDSYQAMVTSILFLITFGVSVSVENPLNEFNFLVMLHDAGIVGQISRS